MTDRVDRKRVDRFTWERAVRSAREVPWARRAVLLLVATYMDAAGDNARPSIATLMAETGLSHGMLADHLSAATKSGWLDDAPGLRGGRRGASGRSSQRCATLPVSVLADFERLIESGQPDDGTSPESEHADVEELPDSAQPESINAPESEPSDDGNSQSPFPTLPDSGQLDTTNQSDQEEPAAAGAYLDEFKQLPDELVILRSKMLAYTATASLRWDHVTPEVAATIRNLIEVHGDAALIDRARQTSRRDAPAVFVQYYLGTWLAMPLPGQTLRGLPSPIEPCTNRDHVGFTLPCSACAADSKAAAS